MHATSTPPAEAHRTHIERTISAFERLGIAVFPATLRTKGSYVEGWPHMPAAEAIARTRRDGQRTINLAGRTGDGVGLLDLDAKEGVDPDEMLGVLRRLVGLAIIAIVRSSRGYHVWLRVTASVGNGFCSYIGGEVLSDPHLAMLPPSVHPTGAVYAWELEPREPEAAVDLRSLGIVPDEPSASAGQRQPITPADSDVQAEFAGLLASTGITNTRGRTQTLHRCPWHDDRSPSLSVNWEAAVFFCFSPACGKRGGLRDLRRLVGADTPSYRQSTPLLGARAWGQVKDDPSGDKSGCVDVAFHVARLADGLNELGDFDKVSDVRSCRTMFRVGKCTSCARTPAFPISCGHPLCPRCMPLRLAADWIKHGSSMPESFTLLRLRPTGPLPNNGKLRAVRSRFAEWRKRSGVAAGIYGVRSDRQARAVVLVAVPSEMAVPAGTKAFSVEVVGERCGPNDVLAWLQAEYFEEATGWSNTDELDALLEETKGRRRFQGFGGVYGEQKDGQKEEEAMEEGKPEKRPLSRVSGGSGASRDRSEHTCSSCGGGVKLLPFTVPASEVDRVGNEWIWRGPPEGRRPAPGGGS